MLVKGTLVYGEGYPDGAVQEDTPFVEHRLNDKV
jgi:hypothetical protein